MKYSLLLLLALPLHAFGQYSRTYTGPTMQQNQQSRQQFNQMTNRNFQEFQARQTQKSMYRSSSNSSSSRMSREEQLKAQAKQLQAEQDANQKLAQLAQEQERKRQQTPAADPQQAALQKKNDDKQLTLLAVKNYRDVFLPGQVSRAFQARQLTTEAEQQLYSLGRNLTANSWWKKQEGAQLASKLKAYGDTLAAITTNLLGFDVASPPNMPASFSPSGLDAQLAANAFDQNAAAQLLREAELSEKLLAGKELAETVNSFRRLCAGANAQSHSKELQAQVQKSLREVNEASMRYKRLINEMTMVSTAQDALTKSASAYLAQNGK